MTKVNSEDEAQELLQYLKGELKNGFVLMQGLKKNTQVLIDLNLSAADIRRMVDELTVRDYCSGPDSDEKYPWKIIAVFGKVYNNKELYIKLSLGFDGSPVVCLSFHPAEFPMAYQFK